MTRSDLILALLAAADGRPYTPVQLQKAAFLVSRNLPNLIDAGPGFDFVPYDYGPFDTAVYSTAEALQRLGEAVIAPSGVGRWSVYSASDAGLDRGRAILAQADPRVREYVRDVSSWVRSLSFSALVKSVYDAYPEMRANSIFQG